MSDMRIDRGQIYTPADLGEVQENLGLQEAATSMPEWQGWDRIENAALDDVHGVADPTLTADLSTIVDQLRSDSEYANLVDLDEKRFLLDVMNNVAGKIDEAAQKSNSEKLLQFSETLNELLELQQEAYSHQIANVKG